MASAFELFESREGDSSGVFGDVSVTRVFQVTCDAATDDPKATLRDLRSGGVPQGSLHPDSGRNGIVALMYTRSTRRGPLVWLVIVHYGPPVFFPTEQPYWEMAIRGSQDQEFVLHDLDGRPIGNPQFETGNAANADGDGGVQFRTTRFVPGDDSVAPPTRGSVESINLWMPHYDNPAKRWVNLEGATRYRRGGEVLLQRSFAKFPQEIGTVIAAINTINKDYVRVQLADFKGLTTLSPPGHFMLANADAQPMPGVIVGQRIPGRIWQVTILLRYNAVPWSPYSRTHTYTVDGKEHAVEFQAADGSWQRSEGHFRLDDETSFTDLLQLFESGHP